MRRRKIRPSVARPVVLFALAAVVLGGCGDGQMMPGAQGARPPTPVSVVVLKTEPVALERELAGRARASVIAEVRPQVTGIVRERLFTEGSMVKAGDPLYQLDDATYRADYNSAKAAVARAEAALELARLNAERAKPLRESEAISEQDYQGLEATYRQAEADLGVARAQFESAGVQLQYARIKSPISGRAGLSTVTQGALVTKDQANVLTTILQLDPVYVDVTQSAAELLALRRSLSESALREAEGIPVRIVLEDGTKYEHDGELTFADAAVDPMTGAVAMRVVVPNPDYLLFPGMYVRAVISNAVVQDGLLVPQQGITRNQQGQATAMIVDDENAVAMRIVDVSRTIGNRWLVRSGLAAGDKVVVEGLQKIRPGMTVQPDVVDADSL